MKPLFKILGRQSLVLLVLAMCFCRAPEDKFAPVDEKFLSIPADSLKVSEMQDLRVSVDTDYGNFVIGFYPDKAPHLTRNFIKLVQQGFYNGLRFHMIVPKYMVIAGDPKGDGQGGPGYWIKPDVNAIPHTRGAVGMSHPPFAPDMIGSQFYVLLTKSFQETNAYPVFGYVVSGMDVLDRIGDIGATGPGQKPGPWVPSIAVRINKMTILKKVGT
jgi:cyclophilin family peptidyl-prolyl cis-trans isomerase